MSRRVPAWVGFDVDVVGVARGSAPEQTDHSVASVFCSQPNIDVGLADVAILEENYQRLSCCDGPGCRAGLIACVYILEWKRCRSIFRRLKTEGTPREG